MVLLFSYSLTWSIESHKYGFNVPLLWECLDHQFCFITRIWNVNLLSNWEKFKALWKSSSAWTYIDFNIFLDIQILKLLHSFFEIFYAFVFCRRILFLLFLTTNIWCLICLTIDDETQFVFAFRLKSLIEKLSWKQLKHCSIFR